VLRAHRSRLYSSQMLDLPTPPTAFLLDIDGVLHVGDEPLPGAIGALERLRELAGGCAL
jgi:ribonucleotide monophosphatase NagD (HAD superfamily)